MLAIPQHRDESMPPASSLPALVQSSVQAHGDRDAVLDPSSGASIKYRDLWLLAAEVAAYLIAIGVRTGDRVGIYAEKSIDTVAAILGTLKAGAAYVPVDPSAPTWRAGYILADCAVSAVILESRLAPALRAELDTQGFDVPLLSLDRVGAGSGLRKALRDAGPLATSVPQPGPTPDDLAYVLYTSGSTGKPKGVMLTHRNAVSFVDWCSVTFAPSADDRCSSHAPFHFDLSILDLYLTLKHGATLVLVPGEVGREPTGLAELIARERVSIWYSAPSILSMLAQFGKLERHDLRMLRMVLFAGEVFPVKHLRELKALVPAPRYFNLYGPTETNVCTYYEIPQVVAADRTAPYPIGGVCDHLVGKVVDERGESVASGREGELCIAGPSVMQGYWNLPEQTARAFLLGAEGRRWYRTGDIVVEEPGGNYLFLGRRDRMIKRRGHRVELGEVEAGLYRHPRIEEAAVVAIADETAGVRIRAFVTTKDRERLSVVDLKRFCAEQLPSAMIPDELVQLAEIPKTSTDKVDYQRLLETA